MFAIPFNRFHNLKSVDTSSTTTNYYQTFETYEKKFRVKLKIFKPTILAQIGSFMAVHYAFK